MSKRNFVNSNEGMSDFEDPFGSSIDELNVEELEKFEVDTADDIGDDDTDGSLFDADSFADFDLAGAAAMSQAQAYLEDKAGIAGDVSTPLAADTPHDSSAGHAVNGRPTTNTAQDEDSEDEDSITMDLMAPVSPASPSQKPTPDSRRADTEANDAPATSRTNEPQSSRPTQSPSDSPLRLPTSRLRSDTTDSDSDSSGYVKMSLGRRVPATYSSGPWARGHQDNVASLQQNQSSTIRDLSATVNELQQQKELDNRRIRDLVARQAAQATELADARRRLQHESTMAQQLLTYANEHRATWKLEKEAIGEEVTRLQELLRSQQEQARQQVADIEERHRRFCEASNESYNTQITALRDELEAMKRQSQKQIAAIERQAEADKNAIKLEATQRAQLFGRTAEAERATVEQQLRTEILRLSEQARADSEKASTTLRKSTDAFQAEIDRQQQEIGALKERVAKSMDQVALSEKLRLEEARTCFKMREEGKVLELKLQLTETKLAEAERRVKQEAEGRRLLLASTAKENSIETPKFTSNIVGDNSLKRENEQLRQEIKDLNNKLREESDANKLRANDVVDDITARNQDAMIVAASDEPQSSVLALFDAIGKSVNALSDAAKRHDNSQFKHVRESKREPVPIHLDDSAAYNPDDEADSFARHFGYEDIDDSGFQEQNSTRQRSNSEDDAGEYIRADEVREYVRTFEERARALDAAMVDVRRSTSVRSLVHHVVAQRKASVSRAWQRWREVVNESRSAETRRLRAALRELETQMLGVYTKARENEGTIRKELEDARLHNAQAAGKVSLFEAGSTAAFTSKSVFLQLQRFIQMQQEYTFSLRDAAHLLLRSMMHLLRMNRRLEGVFEPLLLYSQSKLGRSEAHKLDKHWQSWRAAQEQMRNVDVRAFMAQLSRTEGSHRKRCEAFYLSRLDQLCYFYLLRKRAAMFQTWKSYAAAPVTANDVAYLWSRTKTGSVSSPRTRPRQRKSPRSRAPVRSPTEERKQVASIPSLSTSGGGSFSSSFSAGSFSADDISFNPDSSPVLDDPNTQPETAVSGVSGSENPQVVARHSPSSSHHAHDKDGIKLPMPFGIVKHVDRWQRDTHGTAPSPLPRKSHTPDVRRSTTTDYSRSSTNRSHPRGYNKFTSGGLHDIYSVSVTKEPPSFRNSPETQALRSTAEQIFAHAGSQARSSRDKPQAGQPAGDTNYIGDSDIDEYYGGLQPSSSAAGTVHDAANGGGDDDEPEANRPVIPARQSVFARKLGDNAGRGGGSSMAHAVANSDAMELEASLESDFAQDSNEQRGSTITETPGGGVRLERSDDHDSFASSVGSSQQKWRGFPPPTSMRTPNRGDKTPSLSVSLQVPRL